MSNEISFNEVAIRKQITSRGGSIEINLTKFGFPNEKMVVYQNYLGGGLLGKVCVNDTINSKSPFVELNTANELKEIGERLKRYYFSFICDEDDDFEQSYLQNQRMPRCSGSLFG